MKHSIKAIATAISLAAATTASYTNAGSLQFYGKVGASSCETSVNGNQNSSIYLDDIITTDIGTANTPYGYTAFTINVKDCTAPTVSAVNLNVQFQSDGTVLTSGALKNSSLSGSASNVDLALFNDRDTTVINVNQSGGFSSNAAAIELAVNATSASRTYYVAYYASVTPATAGDVYATANYVVRYP